MDDFLKYYLPVIPLLLTVWGWWVVNSASKELKIREERRKEVDACCVMAADILSKSMDYYTSSQYSNKTKKIERELVFEIYRLTSRIEFLERRSPKFQLEGPLLELHEVITGGDFASTSRKKENIDSPKITEIEHKIHGLMDALELGFDDSFR